MLHLFPADDDCERANIYCLLTKSSSLEPLGQINSNLAQSILGWKRFNFVWKKSHALLNEETIVTTQTFVGDILQRSAEQMSQFKMKWHISFVEINGYAIFLGEIITTFKQHAFILIVLLKFVHC